MPVGRKRQARNFERRAAQFVREISLGKVKKDPIHGYLFVGRGNLKRLIYKRKADDFYATVNLGDFLKDRLSRTPAKHFVPVFPIHSKKYLVQEQFNAPTLDSLSRFLEKVDPNEPLSWLTKKVKREDLERTLCKRLMGKSVNRSITMERLEAAYEELLHNLWPLLDKDIWRIHKQNVLVLGATRDGKIRLTVIDGN